jgi:hypothetical protein
MGAVGIRVFAGWQREIYKSLKNTRDRHKIRDIKKIDQLHAQVIDRLEWLVGSGPQF